MSAASRQSCRKACRTRAVPPGRGADAPGRKRSHPQRRTATRRRSAVRGGLTDEPPRSRRRLGADFVRPPDDPEFLVQIHGGRVAVGQGLGHRLRQMASSRRGTSGASWRAAALVVDDLLNQLGHAGRRERVAAGQHPVQNHAEADVGPPLNPMPFPAGLLRLMYAAGRRPLCPVGKRGGGVAGGRKPTITGRSLSVRMTLAGFRSRWTVRCRAWAGVRQIGGDLTACARHAGRQPVGQDTPQVIGHTYARPASTNVVHGDDPGGGAVPGRPEKLGAVWADRGPVGASDGASLVELGSSQ